jgi:PAS domain S-box-containing protein
MRSPDTTNQDHDPYVAERFAAIVESSFDAIISKDLNSIITSWNPAAQHLFGYTAEEAVGRSILMLIPDHLQAEETDIIQRIRRGERVQSYETVRRRKDGSRVAVSLTVSPVRDPQGRIVGASKIARDISVAKENERRIKLLMREVNHRVKNQFAVILSMIRETVKRATSPETFEEQVRERIMALSRSHDLLVSSEWLGAGVVQLIQEHLRPFGHEDRIALSGPPVQLKSNAVQHLGMAFHELGTNSSKYGALSGDAGRISMTWRVDESETAPIFELIWDETLPPIEDEQRDLSSRRGFGSVVLLRVAPQSLSGTADLVREVGHVRWTLRVPLGAVTGHARDNGSEEDE